MKSFETYLLHDDKRRRWDPILCLFPDTFASLLAHHWLISLDWSAKTTFHTESSFEPKQKWPLLYIPYIFSQQLSPITNQILHEETGRRSFSLLLPFGWLFHGLVQRGYINKGLQVLPNSLHTPMWCGLCPMALEFLIGPGKGHHWQLLPRVQQVVRVWLELVELVTTEQFE